MATFDIPHWIDAGSPTFFCNDMVLDIAAPGVVRARMMMREGQDIVLCCTLIMPEAVVAKNMATARAFMRDTDATVPH